MPWKVQGNEASRRVQVVLPRIVDHTHIPFVGGSVVRQLPVELAKLKVFATSVPNAEQELLLSPRCHQSKKRLIFILTRPTP